MSVSTNLLSTNTSGLETDISGWTAGANTTLSWSTRFYFGARSLGMTATAAGTARATTAARVAVTSGTVYTAYAYFALIAAAAGRTATVTVDWYAAVSGGTVISSSTSAASALPNATTWKDPPALLVATAPAGATYAAISVSVAGLSAGAAVATDAIAFGPPALLTENLLPYNTQGMEVDASGWQNLKNCTIAVLSTDRVEGWQSLQVTATAAGDTQARTVASYSVTPGTEYYSYAWVKAPAVDLEYRMEVWWYDAAAAFINGTLITRSWTPPASTWYRCAVIGKAPVGAVTARVVLRPQASAASEVWLFDQILFRPSPILAGNLLGYSQQGFEATSDDWVAEQGCTIVRDIARSWEGGSSLAITADGTSDPTIRVAVGIPVTPRQVYTLNPRFYHLAGSGQRMIGLLFSWYDSGGQILSTSQFRWIISASEGWRSLTGSAMAPTGAVTMSAGVRWFDATAGTAFGLDQILLTAGGLGILADPIPGRYAVTVSLQGLTQGGYTYWGLWRMLQSDGSMTPLRGSTGDTSQIPITSDLAVLEDYEAPLGVPIVYYLKLWTALPAYTSITTEPPLVLDEPATTHVVMKDPLSPARNASIMVGTLPDWQRTARQGVSQVRGRARPIVISDVRSAKTGTMTLVTESNEERQRLEWLLEVGSTVLLQWPRAWSEDDVYVQIGDVTEKRAARYAEYGDREWDVPLIDVDRPVGATVGSADRTWATVNAERLDWLAVYTGAASWLDVYTGGS
ncbi:hypothetical protein [Streptomyces sp. NPDC058280]|uniref:hypothetical protein n=1 Tax=Streptomyces sp. NPDC058280 TaxID=3346419 RepID=UPI0036E501E5